MGKKDKQPKVILIGDNFIVDQLLDDFNQYSKYNATTLLSISELNEPVSYIIDCSFNQKSQDSCINYSISNKIDKTIIINHWKRDIVKC
jgi:hypothetical protein